MFLNLPLLQFSIFLYDRDLAPKPKAITRFRPCSGTLYNALLTVKLLYLILECRFVWVVTLVGFKLNRQRTSLKLVIKKCFRRWKINKRIVGKGFNYISRFNAVIYVGYVCYERWFDLNMLTKLKQTTV